MAKPNDVAIYFDSSLCTGCKGCQVACKQWNELPAPLGHNVTEFSGSLQSPMDLNGDTRLIQTFHEEESGNKFQPINWAIGRRSCMHCTDAACVEVCSSHALFHDKNGIVNFDTEKCNGCGLCARNCKASCINSKTHEIDYSRCVTCMDCLDKCRQGAITYTRRRHKADAAKISARNQTQSTTTSTGPADDTRRAFLSATAVLATTATLKAQEKKVDGGLAAIEDKKIPARAAAITPPGSLSARNFAQHCTACQLCVAVCPNQVLRPSSDLTRLMQPEMSYERGYCRPECTKCSEVCPAGAIRPITKADKSAIQIGHAVWIKENCICITDKVECGNCARHCPVGAIQMVASDSGNPQSPQIPVVNTERCIGCGACENLCPARPFSAIYVEGHIMHRTV